MIPRDLSHDYLITPLPCGCLADCHDLEVYDVDGEFFDEYCIIACPWCEATFDNDAHIDWLRSDSSPILVMCNREPTLIEVANKVFQAVGQCRCGCPIVRERTEKPYHLEVDAKSVRILEN